MIRLYTHIIPLIVCLCLLASCEETNSPTKKLMLKAQQQMEENPAEALRLLNSIGSLAELSQSDYMQYIVLNVQAKQKNKQDISGDSLIFEAQRYFDSGNNAQLAALANYYAGLVYRTKKMPDDELICYEEASRYAKEANDLSLLAKSYHMQGNVFFDINSADSGLVRFRKALNYYDKIDSLGSNKLGVINTIGVLYEDKNEMDSALYTYKQGLEIAERTNNIPFIATLKHGLGFANYAKGDFNPSRENLLEALELSEDRNENSRIYLVLALLYNKMNQLDSAKMYTDTVIARLPEIDFIYTLKYCYESLSEYNRLVGNYDEAFVYTDSLLSINKQILESDTQQKLLSAEHNKQMMLNQKERTEQRIRLYNYSAMGILVILLLVFFIVYRFKRMKTKNLLLETRNELLNQKIGQLGYLNSIHQNIGVKWTAIEIKVKKLAREYKVENEPPLIVEIRETMENIRKETNNQLIEMLKNHFKTLPNGANVLEQFTDDDYLLLILHRHKYNRTAILNLLGKSSVKKHLSQVAFYLHTKLDGAGLEIEEIEEIMNPDNNESSLSV